ncbi:polyketide synthase [Fusarium pseudocircinatum]|uniref:Polyketide synthase n=1 Tax=Fusarium pseudocircinatum TaxID=56676 RepID=A0A8H5L7G8_9HYPO|nr:polyketide synthase [Fusarium pseudocircinatum]
MAGNALGQSVLEEAKPTVRRKGKEDQYAETLEFDTFQSRGGNPEDLMDEERWLDFPVHVSTPLKKVKIQEADRDGSLLPTAGRKRYIWSPDLVFGHRNNRIPRADTGRKMNERHLAVKLAARVYHYTRVLKDEAKEWLGIASGTQLATDKRVSGVFVGISALSHRSIFMVKSSSQHLPDGFYGVSRQQLIEDSLKLDNTELVELVFEPGSRIQGHEIIWTENMLIPGNISHVKRALHDHLDDGEKDQFLQLLKREHHLLLSGNHPASVARTLPSNEEPSRKPLVSRAIQGGKEYSNLHFTLNWPPMALLEFPETMISEMQRFLDQYPSDNVPLNIALAATIIYFDIEETNDHQMEGFMDSFASRKPSLVQKVPLAPFIIYFTHMLSLNALLVSPNTLSSPASSRGYKVHSDSCIYARFHYGAPKWLLTKAVRQSDDNCFQLTGNPTITYWNTTTPGTVKALTGPARMIGPVFPDIGSKYYNRGSITSCVKRWFGDETYYTQNFQFCLDNPELERKNMATRADELIRIADRLAIPPTQRRTSHKTMLLEWDGMEEHLKSLREEGKLKRLAAPEYSTPPAKRAQAVEPTLGSDIKGKILQTIKGLAAASCDWDNLLKDLQTPAPTMKAIQSSFSHVRSLCQLFGQPTGDAIEAIFRLRNTPDAFGIILPQIQVLGESSLIKDQVEAFKKIEALLGQPPSDSAVETALGGNEAQQ